MEESKIKYDDVIKSISENQHQILYNIMNLHNNGEPFYADMTYSSGKFYEQDKKYFIPQPKIKMDVYPQSDDIIKIEPLGKLPLDDNSIPSLVIDLPFVISCGPSMSSNEKGKNIISKRFSGYYPRENMFESYYHWINEAYRVLQDNGILVFKCQGSVSGGIQLLTPEFSWLVATQCGFYPKDQFFTIAKARLHSGKIKKQEHARKFTSTFWVFKKDTKKRDIRYFNYMSDEQKTNFFGKLKCKM